MGQHYRIARCRVPLAAGAFGSARWIAAAALVLAGACKGRSEQKAAPAPSARPSVALPVDRAPPGEIAEGTERAFGFPIPRRMSIETRFPDAVFAVGEIPPERVSNYVRERVIAAHVETGPAKTVFTGVTVKDSPQHRMRIEVVARGNNTELLVRDETRPPAKSGLTPDERWRELGFDPNGKPLDPTRLE